MSQVILLSPHNDDESLFAAFQVLRSRPHVVICTRALVQQDRGYTFNQGSSVLPISPVQRELETAGALGVLGVEYWDQWDIPDTFDLHDARSIARLDEKIGRLAQEYYFCIAPAYESGGHAQHNIISMLATKSFAPEPGGDRLTEYLTYTRAGRSRNGTPVEFEPHWPALKMRALACYESQIQHPSTRDHFMGDLWEYTI